MKAINSTEFCKRLPAIVFLAALVSGCASGLSRDECQTADWHLIGYEDGVRGLQESQISKHRKSCAKHNVVMNLDDYRRGREEGIESFCQPGNGYSQGRSGRRYAGVCPANLESDFLHAYRQGRELYQLEVSIQRSAHRLSRKRQRLADIETEMRDASLELLREGVPTERRIILLDELRRLE